MCNMVSSSGYWRQLQNWRFSTLTDLDTVTPLHWLHQRSALSSCAVCSAATVKTVTGHALLLSAAHSTHTDVRGLSDKRFFSTVVSIAAVSTLLISSIAATVGYPALQRFHMCAKNSSSSSSGAAKSNLNSAFRGRLTLKSNRATTVVHVGSCRIVPQENSTSCEETSAESTEFDDAFEHKTTVTAAAAALAQFGTTRRRHSGDLNSTKTSTLSKSGTLKRKEKNVLFSKRRTLWLLRTLRRTFLYVQSELNRKPEQMLSVSQYALTVHDTVELFDAATEDMFKHLQVTVTDR
eukprot:21398-Heterococcus_DN1.PRE.2